MTFDFEAARTFLSEKRKKRRETLDNSLRQAQSDARNIIQMIISDYNPERIYQWGSLVHTNHFSEISDIDIAIEGLISVQAFFSILNKADGMTDFPLDIVELEKIEPLHAQSIRQKGKLIYERK